LVNLLHGISAQRLATGPTRCSGRTDGGLGRVSEKLIAPLLFALIPETTVPFFIDEIGMISWPFVEQKKTRKENTVLLLKPWSPSMDSRHSWGAIVNYLHLFFFEIVNYLHLWEILAEVELQPTKLFLFLFFFAKSCSFSFLSLTQVQER
jgi:hypothetical protein